MTRAIQASRRATLTKTINPLNWDYHVQHKVIPWATHGHHLTAKLALWALAMMALHGDSYVDYSYPDLNTWRVRQGGGIVHNTTGATRARSSRNRKMQEPNPHWEEIRERAEREGNDDDGEEEHEDGDEDIGESQPDAL